MRERDLSIQNNPMDCSFMKLSPRLLTVPKPKKDLHQVVIRSTTKPSTRRLSPGPIESYTQRSNGRSPTPSHLYHVDQVSLVSVHATTLKVESFAGTKFRGDKLSRTPRAKIKFRGYKLSRMKEILVEISYFRAIFSSFSIDFSRMT